MSEDEEKKIIEISEKTFIKLSVEKFLSFLIVFFVVIGGVYIYTNRLSILEHKYDEINQKLDLIIKKQDSDHEFIIKHEYENLNKKNK
jgi:hypothetical protein